MHPEQKILETLRTTLANAASVQAYVADRVYAQHISSVDNPQYPAISFFLLISKPGKGVPISRMSVQIDLWFPSTRTVDDMFACREAVRDLLHNKPSIDIFNIKAIQEEEVGPVLYEADTKIFHLPIRYTILEIV